MLRLREPDPPHQIQGGPQPVVGELQVLRRVPGAAGHGSRVRCGLTGLRRVPGVAGNLRRAFIPVAGSRGRARQTISR